MATERSRTKQDPVPSTAKRQERGARTTNDGTGVILPIGIEVVGRQRDLVDSERPGITEIGNPE